MLILLPFLGMFLYCIAFIVNVYFFDELVVEFLWFESITSYFGGYVMFFLGAYGYIADTTSVKSRTVRLAIMDGMFAVAETIGSYINPYLYAEFGYYGNFGCALVFNILGLLIAYLTVQNNKITTKKHDKKGIYNLGFQCWWNFLY